MRVLLQIPDLQVDVRPVGQDWSKHVIFLDQPPFASAMPAMYQVPSYTVQQLHRAIDDSTTAPHFATPARRATSSSAVHFCFGIAGLRRARFVVRVLHMGRTDCPDVARVVLQGYGRAIASRYRKNRY